MTGDITTEPILFDEHGFLEEPDQWTRDIALGIAAELSIDELSADHWLIIDHLRQHYYATGNLPVQRTLCRELDLDPDCVVALFGGPLEAWKVAGLPDPGIEARTYMENEDPYATEAEIR